MWACVGFPTIDSASILKASFIFITGLIQSLTVYIYIASAMQLSSSIAQACFDVQYVVGVSVTYLIDSDGIDLEFLVIGALSIMFGIGFMLLSEYTKENHIEGEKRAYDDGSSQTLLRNEATGPNFRKPLNTVPILSESQQEVSTDLSAESNGPLPTRNKTRSDVILYWALLAMSGGVLISTFAFLITLARTGANAVTNPALILLLLESGQFVGSPFAIYLFGYLDLLGIKRPDEEPSTFDNMVTNLCDVPVFDSTLSFFLGFALSAAYGMYFYGSSGDVPYAVAFLLFSFIIFFSVMAAIVLGEYEGIPIVSWTYSWIAIGAAFYIVGIYVLVAYSF